MSIAVRPARASSSGRPQVRTAVACKLIRIATPVGEAVVIEDPLEQLRVLDWADHAERWQRMLQRHVGPDVDLQEVPDSRCASALRSYLAGDLRALDELQTASSGTAFQRSVWTALRAIPLGQTRSYAGLAASIGQPSAVRAVAAANAANPISIVVPCHRVIGSNGSLTGYAGGLARKAWLLRHEGVRVQQPG